MAHYGREDIGVAIPDGSGYVGTLNIYHELHCIVRHPAPEIWFWNTRLTISKKRLHQYMYEDYYFKDITPKQKEMNRLHNGKLPPSIPLIPTTRLKTPSHRALPRFPPPSSNVPR